MLGELLQVLLVLTLGLLSPGPDFFLVVKNSLGGNRRRAYGTVAGITLGLSVQMLVVSLGFVAAPPEVLSGVQLPGAAFLAYLGLRALLSDPASAGGGGQLDGARALPGARSGFVEGLLCNLTNPKAFLFFVSLFVQVLHPGTPPAWRVMLPVAIVVHGVAAWSLVVLAVQSPPVERRLQRAQRWLPRAFGLALLVLAAFVAWQGLS